MRNAQSARPAGVDGVGTATIPGAASRRRAPSAVHHSPGRKTTALAITATACGDGPAGRPIRSVPASWGGGRESAEGHGPAADRGRTQQRTVGTQRCGPDLGCGARSRAATASSISAWAASKKTSPEAQGNRTRPPRPTPHPTDWPPRPPPGPPGCPSDRRTESGASGAGCPVMASIDRPDASASRQPRPPQAQPGPRAPPPHGRCGRRSPRYRQADGRRARCPRRPRSTPPWPGSCCIPRAAPAIPRQGPGPWRRCPRQPAGPTRCSRRWRRGKWSQAPILRGDTVSPPAVIGPPHPTPHTSGMAVVADQRLLDDRGQRAEGDVGIGSGRASAPGPRSRRSPTGRPRPRPSSCRRCRRPVPPALLRVCPITPSPWPVRAPGGTMVTGRSVDSVSRRGGSGHGSSRVDRGPCC